MPRLPRTTLPKALLLLFWALYFTLVFASNLTDALKAAGALGPGFPFASGNYALVARVTALYATPPAVVAALFAGVLLWEGWTAGLLWQALARTLRAGVVDRPAAYTAFTAGIGLWAAFILMDELFIAYDVAGLEGAHVGLFGLQLLSLLALALLPDAAGAEPGRADAA